MWNRVRKDKRQDTKNKAYLWELAKDGHDYRRFSVIAPEHRVAAYCENQRWHAVAQYNALPEDYENPFIPQWS